MTNEAKMMLEKLDDFFASDDVEVDAKQEVWNVLSALRGPDKREDSKLYTTVPIRRAAFPRMAATVCYLPVAFGFPTTEYLGPKEAPVDHFHYHVYQAAVTLGLI